MGIGSIDHLVGQVAVASVRHSFCCLNYRAKCLVKSSSVGYTHDAFRLVGGSCGVRRVGSLVIFV